MSKYKLELTTRLSNSGYLGIKRLHYPELTELDFIPFKGLLLDLGKTNKFRVDDVEYLVKDKKFVLEWDLRLCLSEKSFNGIVESLLKDGWEEKESNG